MRLTRAAACRSFAGCLLALSFISPAAAQRPASVLDLAAQEKNLTTFVAAVHTAGLDDMLRGAGPITVYAPTDAAFAALPDAQRTELLNNPDRARALVLGLIAKDDITMRDHDIAVTSGSVASAAGPDITFALDGDRPTVNGAHLLRSDMRAANGCVHTLDKVPLR